MSLTANRCLNCQTELTGTYCHHCGQKVVRGRLTVGEILRELPGKIFSLERGLWLTFLCLWVRPGRVCLDYVQGKRQLYVNPVSYFFIGASLQLASLWFSAPVIRQSVQDSLQNARSDPGQAKVFDSMDRMVGGDTAAAMADIYLTVIAQAYTYLAFFAFAIPLAMTLWLFHRRSSFHFAEVMVFTLYVAAHCMIVTAFTSPVFSRIGGLVQGLTAQGFYVGMVCWAHHGFFPNGWWSRSLTVIAIVLAMLCFFSSIVLSFAGSWVAYLVWHQWNT